MRQSGRYEIERVELPIIDATHVSQQDSLVRRVSTPESFLSAYAFSSADASGGDDFELSSDAQFDDDADETFELSENLLLSEESDHQATDTGADFYALQSPLPELDQPALSEVEKIAESSSIEEPPIRSDSLEPPIPLVQAESEIPPSIVPEVPQISPEEELLKIAADEEKDIQRVRKSLRSKDTFVIFCPQGCRIRVKEQHRGKSGKCPRCQSEFVVPKKQPVKIVVGSGEPAPPQKLESRYKKWLSDIRLHTVDPQKLRIKADSLLNECQAVDLGFAEDGLLIATLLAGKFGANAKKLTPLRQAMIDHFQNQGTVESLTVPTKKVYTTDLLAMFTLAQPTPAGTESLFADIPVFGTNRIAVRIPKMADDPHPKYLSFCLSEFRAFVDGLSTICHVNGLGANSEIPLTDEYATSKCHLKHSQVFELNKLNYYQKDPGFKLEVSGWRCAACGIVISEAGRADAKLGGANGKGLAKAKCPKCSNKYGNLPLYQLEGLGSAADDAQQTSAGEENAQA